MGGVCSEEPRLRVLGPQMALERATGDHVPMDRQIILHPNMHRLVPLFGG